VRNVGIYVFDEVEVLDFAGPFEVFSTASRIFGRAQPGAEPPFEVFTVGASRSPVTARGGLVVQPRYSFADHPKIDVLLMPGGVVAAELERPRVIAWVATRAATAELAASVCTGAFFLAGQDCSRGSPPQRTGKMSRIYARRRRARAWSRVCAGSRTAPSSRRRASRQGWT